jgi:hypothetical protein
VRVAPRSLLLCAIAPALIALGGCGASEADQVRAKMRQFVTATAGKDYKALCGQVLAPSLLARLAAANVPCERAMQIGLSAVQNPVLSVARITVTGDTATAITLSGARGEVGSVDSIGLVKTANGWRVESLGSPVTPAKPKPQSR